MTVDIDLETGQLSIAKLFLVFPLSKLYSLKGSHYAQPTAKGWGVTLHLLQGGVSIIYLEFFCKEDVAFPSFVNLFNQLHQYELVDIYFVLSVVIQCDLACFLAQSPT